MGKEYELFRFHVEHLSRCENMIKAIRDNNQTAMFAGWTTKFWLKMGRNHRKSALRVVRKMENKLGREARPRNPGMWPAVRALSDAQYTKTEAAQKLSRGLL